MMTRGEMLALADRVEREEPSRRMYLDIAQAAGWKQRKDGAWERPDGGLHYKLPDWLRSLDAAVTLVPLTHTFWDARQHNGHGEALVYEGYSPGAFARRGTGRGKTVAMALCAAALRARSSLLKEDGDVPG
jgi:hypothetical protein